MDLIWDVALFLGGFCFGVLTTIGGLVVARVRREAAVDGDRLVQKMGPLGARRFLEAATTE